MEEREQTVLVVDDEPAILAMMRSLLSDEGCAVLTAQNGQEALALALEAQPDLIITDLMMPVMDGQELRRRLREEPRTADIPVMLMTVAGRTPFRDQFTAVIRKPFGYNDILSSIRAYLS